MPLCRARERLAASSVRRTSGVSVVEVDCDEDEAPDVFCRLFDGELRIAA